MNAGPRIKPIRPVEFRQPDVAQLDNGIPVYLLESGTEDITRTEFSYNAGSIHEKRHLAASTTNLMLTEGSEKYRSEEISRMLDTWSAFFHLSPERDRAGLVIYFLSRNTGKVLDIVSEILLRPVFPQGELELLMKKRYNRFRINRERVSYLAAEQFFEMIFGNEHPYGRQTKPEDFQNPDSLFLRDFYASFYIPGNLAIFVSGRIQKDTIEHLNRCFGNDIGKNQSALQLAPNPRSQKERTIKIEKKDALQSAIRIGSPTINKKHRDYHGLKVLNVILGGYFGSRLMKNIREEKGYTYGISSSLVSLQHAGFFSISAEVSNLFTQNAINEIYNEIRRLQSEPVGRAELNVVRNYMMGELIRMFDGPFASAESFRSAWEFGFDNSYYSQFAEVIKSIKADELMNLASKYLQTDKMYQVVAG